MPISDKTPTPFNILESDPNTVYYLTGSRFFGGWRVHSDWDFFAQDDGITREYLITNGFRRIEQSPYLGDPTIVHVYRKDGVDVQLVRDAIIKWKAQNLLKDLEIIEPTDLQWRIAISKQL